MTVDLVTISSATVGGMLAGVVCLLIGGVGGLRTTNKRVSEVEDDVEFLSDRFERREKRRAGLRSVEGRDREADALILAAQIKAKGNSPAADLVGR